MGLSETELKWQRALDPSHFNKATGAQYHTAPTVIPHDSPDYPKRMPKSSICLQFFIDEASWIVTPQHISIKKPVFLEGKPKTKSAKHGAVFIMDKNTAYCAIPVKENYYWSAQVLSEHEVVYAVLSPGKRTDTGKSAKTRIIAVFKPNNGE